MASDFLQTYGPLANDVASQTGLDPAVVLGIIDTETSGGQRVLSNNIFGISPGGKGGQYVARYPDVAAGTQAFITLMQQPRYAKVPLADNPAAQAAALVAAGYNTADPAYAKKVGGRALQFGKEVGYQDPGAPPAAGPAATPAAPQPATKPGEDPRMAVLQREAAGGAPAKPGEDPRMTDLEREANEKTPRTGILGAVDAVLAPGERLAAAPAETRPDLSSAADAADVPTGPAPEGSLQRWGEGTAVGRTVNAAIEGFHNAPNFYAPEMHAAVDQGPVGRFITNPLLDAASGVAGALGAAYGHGAYEAGAAIGGPKGGRDANALAQMVPVLGAMPGVIRPGGGPVSPSTIVRNTLAPWEDAGPRAAFSPRAEFIDGQRQNITARQLPDYEFTGGGPFRTREGNIERFFMDQTPETVAKMAETNPAARRFMEQQAAQAEAERLAAGERQGGGGPAPVIAAADRGWMTNTHEHIQEILAENRAAGIPGDLSAAATPEELSRLTPGQMKAYRRQAELGQVLSPAGTPDTNIYVDGSTPTRGQYSGDVNEARIERSLREKDDGKYKAQDDTNRNAQIRSYENMMGTDIGVDDIRQLKARAAERDGQAFVNAARPLDLQPAAAWVDAQLRSKRNQEHPDIMSKLREYRASLFQEDGTTLKTDPNSGWGMHDKLADDLEKAKDRTRDQRFAKKQTQEFKKIIDQVNNDASGGAFQTFLDHQSQYAAQINAQTILQEWRKNLTNRAGDINAAAFHKFVADLATRRGRAGIDPAMDIPDETMRGLININEDLKRAGNLDLGKARGSNTHMMFEMAKMLGIGGAHAATAAISLGNPMANMALHAAGKGISGWGNNWLLNRRINRSFEPPPGGFDYNALEQGP